MFHRITSHSSKRSERKAREEAERKQHGREEARRMKDYLNGMDRDHLKVQLRDIFFPRVRDWMDELCASISSAARFGQFRKSGDETFNDQVRKATRCHRDVSRNFELCLSDGKWWQLKIKTNLAPDGKTHPVVEFAGKLDDVKYSTLRSFLAREDCKLRCKRWICTAIDPLVQKFDHVLSGGYRLLMTLKSREGSSCVATLQPVGGSTRTPSRDIQAARPYRHQDDRRRYGQYFHNDDDGKLRVEVGQLDPLVEMQRQFYEEGMHAAHHHTGTRPRANVMCSRY